MKVCLCKPGDLRTNASYETLQLPTCNNSRVGPVLSQTDGSRKTTGSPDKMYVIGLVLLCWLVRVYLHIKLCVKGVFLKVGGV